MLLAIPLDSLEINAKKLRMLFVARIELNYDFCIANHRACLFNLSLHTHVQWKGVRVYCARQADIRQAAETGTTGASLWGVCMMLRIFLGSDVQAT
eukprot:8523603-Alexandrium_andersonii.AAC.1